MASALIYEGRKMKISVKKLSEIVRDNTDLDNKKAFQAVDAAIAGLQYASSVHGLPRSSPVEERNKVLMEKINRDYLRGMITAGSGTEFVVAGKIADIVIEQFKIAAEEAKDNQYIIEMIEE